MNFEPTPDQAFFIQRAIADGRYRTAEEALHDVLSQWETAERIRLELIAALNEAEEDMQAGRFHVYEKENLTELAEEIKLEGRKRINREPH